MGDGNANGTGDVGVGRIIVGDVGGVCVDGPVFARVTSGMPWTREVRGNSHTSPVMS